MTTMDVTSQVDLYDSDILKIEQGPLAWANKFVGSRRDLDDFVEKLKDQFLRIGFFIYVELGRPMRCGCNRKCVNLQNCPSLVMVQDDVFLPMVTITGRTELQAFDFEQMQHEVQNNLLEIPGEQKGKIKFDEKEFLRKHQGHSH